MLPANHRTQKEQSANGVCPAPCSCTCANCSRCVLKREPERENEKKPSTRASSHRRCPEQSSGDSAWFSGACPPFWHRHKPRACSHMCCHCSRMQSKSCRSETRTGTSEWSDAWDSLSGSPLRSSTPKMSTTEKVATTTTTTEEMRKSQKGLSIKKDIRQSDQGLSIKKDIRQIDQGLSVKRQNLSDQQVPPVKQQTSRNQVTQSCPAINRDTKSDDHRRTSIVSEGLARIKLTPPATYLNLADISQEKFAAVCESVLPRDEVGVGGCPPHIKRYLETLQVPIEEGSETSLPSIEEGSGTSLLSIEEGSGTSLPSIEEGSGTSLPSIEEGSGTSLLSIEEGSGTSLPSNEKGSKTSLPPIEGSGTSLPPIDEKAPEGRSLEMQRDPKRTASKKPPSEDEALLSQKSASRDDVPTLDIPATGPYNQPMEPASVWKPNAVFETYEQEVIFRTFGVHIEPQERIIVKPADSQERLYYEVPCAAELREPERSTFVDVWLEFRKTYPASFATGVKDTPELRRILERMGQLINYPREMLQHSFWRALREWGDSLSSGGDLDKFSTKFDRIYKLDDYHYYDVEHQNLSCYVLNGKIYRYIYYRIAMVSPRPNPPLQRRLHAMTDAQLKVLAAIGGSGARLVELFVNVLTKCRVAAALPKPIKLEPSDGYNQ